MTDGADTLTTATFGQQTQVELGRDGNSRWFMWVTRRGRRTRRRDFATPFLDHGRRTAEHWFGEPTNGWHAPEGKV